MKNKNKITQELTENFTQALKDGYRLYDFANYLDGKRKCSWGDAGLLVINFFSALSSASNTINSFDELIAANKAEQSVSAIDTTNTTDTFVKTIENLTPLQLSLFNPSLYLLSQSKLI